jgi:putative hydrolase of HD superfamily
MQKIMDRKRFEQQISFLKEIDKIKNVFRRTRLLDDSRYENDTEHTWHLAVMAITLAEHTNSNRLDTSKVVKMVLLHDIVEIDAGYTLIYDVALRAEKKEEESWAAARIFGLLPEDQRNAFRSLWEEFEARETPEAKFAAALDRLEPIIQNASTRGHAWHKHGISREQVEAVNRHISEGSDSIWQYVEQLFVESEKKGYFPEISESQQRLSADAENGASEG